MMIFVLRHADRDPVADALSPAGTKRAKFLAHMLAGSGVSEAYCSDAQRTHETLAPLKQLLGSKLAITEFSASTPGGPDGHVQAVIAAAAALSSPAIAIAVSHSNTVGPIVQGLGGGGIAPIGESEFDRLYVLVDPRNGTKTLLQLRY
ncbi:histidine phosphatase family protein (plasmid) [Rhizobium ruizarguesonis]|uniref:histidine phosphatase family protein n=1 Tax=Rhizobium ruizarguesonis TaxID=2081791 RepID=UPI00102F5BF2|nr:histidine phosphatase family protein [Rhizobium ruizarguesonis]TBB15610.1 histidine phosphatase family protein [Rhizobium ruizarguesonis]